MRAKRRCDTNDAVRNEGPAFEAQALFEPAKRGADSRARDLSGDDAFAYACLGGSRPSAAALAQLGCDTRNCSNKKGTTPLIWAASRGHGDVIRFLLEDGDPADIQAQSLTGGQHSTGHARTPTSTRFVFSYPRVQISTQGLGLYTRL